MQMVNWLTSENGLTTSLRDALSQMYVVSIAFSIMNVVSHRLSEFLVYYLR